MKAATKKPEKFNRRGNRRRMGKRSMCGMCGCLIPFEPFAQCPQCGESGTMHDVGYDDQPQPRKAKIS